MSTRLLPFIAFAIGLSAWMVVGLGVSSQGLAANTGNLIALVDTDNDGLDDALEARLGTLPTSVDTDGDGLTDLEEKLFGFDPLKVDVGQIPPSVPPALYIDLYALGDEVVVEACALYRNSLKDFRFVWADPIRNLQLSVQDMMAFFVDDRILPTAFSNRRLRVARFVLPRAWFEAQGSVAFGGVAVADYSSTIADSFMLFQLDGILVELRQDLVSTNNFGTGGSGLGSGVTSAGAQQGGSHSNTGNNGGNPGGDPTSSGGGGVFPVDPQDEPSVQGQADEVCVQTLTEVANMGGGKVAYKVTDAYCDPLPNAICFSGCTSSIEDIIIGIDIIGLIGG